MRVTPTNHSSHWSEKMFKLDKIRESCCNLELRFSETQSGSWALRWKVSDPNGFTQNRFQGFSASIFHDVSENEFHGFSGKTDFLGHSIASNRISQSIHCTQSPSMQAEGLETQNCRLYNCYCVQFPNSSTCDTKLGKNLVDVFRFS